MPEKFFEEPLLKDIMLTMAAWRRLINKAQEFERNGSIAGTYILTLMNEAWVDAEKDLEKSEKDLRKQMKKEAKK